MGEEIWKWVPGYEGLYVVSDKGGVMSVPRDIAHGPKCGRRLKASMRGGGYEQVTLSVGGRQCNSSVHRLVAMAFVPNPEEKPQVNHIDGNKLNNSAENLEWVTASENALHAYRNLPRKKANHFHAVKLNAEQVAAIRASEGTAVSIAKRFGISDVMVLRIKKGLSWKEQACL